MPELLFGKKKKGAGEEEEKEKRGRRRSRRGRSWRPPVEEPRSLPRRAAMSPSGLQGGRLRKQHRAWLLREGAVPGVVALRPLLTCCAPRRRPCLLPLPRALQRRLAGTPRSGAAAPGRCRRGSHGPRRPASSAPGRSAARHCAASPLCPEREVSTEAFTLMWTRPSS
jgi:hypothetical protein